MKLEVNWGEKADNSKFTVKGDDIKSAVKFLNSKGEWGKFKGDIKYKYWADSGNVTKVRLTPSYKIKMPSWPAYRKQPQTVKDDWDSMYKALLKHENKHKEIFITGLNKLEKDIEALSAITVNDLKSMLAKEVGAIQKKHDAYDKQTEHGAARGVELTIPN